MSLSDMQISLAGALCQTFPDKDKEAKDSYVIPVRSLKPEHREPDVCCLSREPINTTDVLCLRSCCLHKVVQAERVNPADDGDSDVEFV